MFPVYLFNDRTDDNIGIGANEFKTEFLKICESHRKNDRARVFAFLLTDFHNDSVNRMILDSSVWNELHSISGKYMTVFHFDYNSDMLNELFRTGKTHYAQNHLKGFFQNLSDMFETTEFEKLEMPAILFFQTESSNILDFFCIELEQNTLEDNIHSIKDFIQSAVKGVEGVHQQYLGNSNEIYQLLKSSVEATKFKKVWTKRIKNLIPIIRIIK